MGIEALREFTNSELKLELSRRESDRRQRVKGHIVHDDMLYGEVLHSMIKGGYKVYYNLSGDRWGNEFCINPNLKVYALYNVCISGNRIVGLGTLYKDHIEAYASDFTWGYIKAANGWE